MLRLEIGDGGLLYFENACIILVTHFGRSCASTGVVVFRHERGKTGGMYSVTGFFICNLHAIEPTPETFNSLRQFGGNHTSTTIAGV